MRAGNAWDFGSRRVPRSSTSPTTGHTTSTARSRATPRPGSARSAAARTATETGRSATARSPPTCSDGCWSASAARPSRSCSRARCGRGSAPSRTRRSSSTTRGFPLVEGGICTTLRDLARFGLMCLEGGTALGQQIVPAEWIARVRIRDADLIEAYRASDRGRSRHARRLLPRQVVDLRRPARRLHGARDERAVDPHPPPGACRDREVLDLPGSARRRPASRSIRPD